MCWEHILAFAHQAAALLHVERLHQGPAATGCAQVGAARACMMAAAVAEIAEPVPAATEIAEAVPAVAEIAQGVLQAFIAAAQPRPDG